MVKRRTGPDTLETVASDLADELQWWHDAHPSVFHFGEYEDMRRRAEDILRRYRIVATPLDTSTTGDA